jgi:geranylgeranylglycerol-phosphate geranylgeranyltransferase
LTLDSIRQVIITVRPHNGLIAAASVLVGEHLAGAGPGRESLLASGAVFLVCAGAYAFNDLFDLDTDRVAKPGRPLPGGRISRRAVLAVGDAAWVGAVALGVLAGGWTLRFLAAWMVLLMLYSWKLKGRGLWGHVLVSVVASSGFLLGGLIGERVRAGAVPFLIALVIHLARETAKAVEDIEGDRVAGIRTYAVSVGGAQALGATFVLMAGVIAVSLLPFVLGIYGALYIIAVAVVIYPLLVWGMVMIWRRGREDTQGIARRVSLVLKAAMPVGVLAFYLAGV